jgi:DNA-binding NarL/FixJ family response regulator
MNRIILADDQAIFRAGAARVLALEDDMRIVAQCDAFAKCTATLPAFRGAVVIVARSLFPDHAGLASLLSGSQCRGILIAENAEQLAETTEQRFDGVVNRAVTGAELIDCVRKVARGQRCIHRANLAVMQVQDQVGARVRDRLTPKEMQIVALIVQGCKNKEIAHQLGTKEQVIKNYLRNIYDKTGVSDRLELALFTLHHRMLAEAAARAGTLLQARSA